MLILELKNFKKAEHCSLERLLFMLGSVGASNHSTVEKRVLVLPLPVLMISAY